MSRRRALREPLVHCPCSGRGPMGLLPVPAAKGKAVPSSAGVQVSAGEMAPGNPGCPEFSLVAC